MTQPSLDIILKRIQENLESPITYELTDPVICTPCGHNLDKTSALKLFGPMVEKANNVSICQFAGKDTARCPICKTAVAGWYINRAISDITGDLELLMNNQIENLAELENLRQQNARMKVQLEAQQAAMKAKERDMEALLNSILNNELKQLFTEPGDLLKALQKPTKEQLPQLVNLFDQLNSQDGLIVKKAEETINYLQEQQISFHTLALHSFPLWPVDDASALKQIALDQSASKHALLRKRAFQACRYLVTNDKKEGYDAAAILASKKIYSEDRDIQVEGIQYFDLLLNQWHPKLSQDDLIMAISIAKKICLTDQWSEAYQFFRKLVKKWQNVAELKNIVLDLCASDNTHAFYVGSELSLKIIDNHYKCAGLMEIPLQAAISMCASEYPYRRGKGLDIFWSLLVWSPVPTIDPLLQTLEIESQRKSPHIDIITRLEELAGHDFSNCLHTSKEAILQRAKEDAPLLLRILTNLSTCDSSNIQQQALKLKQKVEKRCNPQIS